MDTPFETLRQEALTALARGDARGAFSRFRRALEYPGAPELARPEPWRQALDTLAALCAAIAGEPLAELVRAARDDDTQALCDLGFELMEHRLYGIAATVLRRGHQLAPRSHLLFLRLGNALTKQGLHEEAVCHLRGAPGAAEQNHLSRYLLAFNLLMTGDLEAARALLPGLPTLRDRDEDGQDVDPSDADAERTLEEMIARADAVRDVTPLNTRDLRGWHFAITGGVLLHLSPYGFDEGMNGRYAYVSDSEERCREGIHRVAEVLRAAELTPPRVFVLPERSSAILAHATARVLGLPAVPWPAEGSPEPGLVVVYALDALEPSVLETLAAHHPGQLLWCHALCWTEPASVSPDLVTSLSQKNVAPWGKRLQIDPETQRTQQVPPRTEPVEELARAVAAAPLDAEAPDTDLPALLALVTAARRLTGEAAGGLFRQRGARRWMQDASPVPSNRFR